MGGGVRGENRAVPHHAPIATAGGRQGVAGAVSRHVEVTTNQLQGRSQVGCKGSEVDEDGPPGLVVEVWVYVDRGQEHEPQGVMTHSGDEQVWGVVLHPRGGGWVLERTSPADHKACTTALGRAGVGGIQSRQGLQEGGKRPEFLEGKDVDFQGEQDVHHKVDMGCNAANVPGEEHETRMAA